jgi:methanesulfonate monooxygenase small subunit
MTRERSVVEELVYRSCVLLDEQDFPGFLALCHPAFHYRLTAWSPEIKKEMTWLDRDRQEMETFFRMLPMHNTDHAQLTRHATVYRVDFDGARQRADVVTALQIYRTPLDGGATGLLAVGKYYDEVSLAGEAPCLSTRRVQLVTRDLGWGNHIPF